ncbi:EpsG family protein [Pedobacter arcticus]|uniref:EpsG family protein n=1 Tax=Pedobacter arcticus TaxID=752140 RepID=UPI0003020FD0|nr:EpsG family protein [Pedobacter arcticus]
MIAYWFIFSVIALYCLLFPSQDKTVSKPSFHLIIIMVLIILVFFAGLRTESNDYGGYQKIYERIPSLTSLTLSYFLNNNLPMEKAFIFLMSFLKLFSGNVVLLMLVVAGFSVCLNIRVIEKLSPYIFLSILLYYCHNFLLKETVQIRQGLASALVFSTFLFFNKTIRRSLVIILAGFIQSSAFAAFIPYFLTKIINKTSTKTLTLIILFTFILNTVFSGKDVATLLLSSIGLPAAISGYVGYDLYDYSLGFLSPIFIKMLLIFTLLLMYREKLLEKYNFFPILFSFYYCAILWFIYFNDFAIVAARISNLFSLGEVLFVPMLIATGSEKYKYYFYFAAIAFTFFNLFLNLRTDMVFPYKNILF